MSKYVCDFDEMEKQAKSLCDTASNMMDAVSDYGSEIDSNLAGWRGPAKNFFDSTNSQQISKTKNDAYNLDDIGSFINEVSYNVRKLEEELANLEI